MSHLIRILVKNAFRCVNFKFKKIFLFRVINVSCKI